MRRYAAPIQFFCCFALAALVPDTRGADSSSTNAPGPITNAPVFVAAPATNSAEIIQTNTPIETTGQTNEPYQIPELQILQFPVALTREAKFAIANSKNPVVDYSLAAIAVPRNFDPKFPTPILLVSGTSDGDGSSIRAMHSFTNMALRLGWMVIAADGPYGKPPNDNPQWRWAMVSSLLEHMHKSWPQSRRWPIAAAGVSGGGKWSGVIGAVLAKQRYNLIGVFMAGVNQDLASDAAKMYEPAVRYKNTPIFLSSGTDDMIATPEHQNEVKESLLHSGFSNVRLETFKGGHVVSPLELRKALTWFVETYAKPAN